MTNLERLKQMDAEDFWKSVMRLRNNRLSEYIDYVAYLNSESDNIGDFVKYEEVIEVYPSEADIISYQNERNLALSTNEKLTDAEREEYRQQHKKECPYLGNEQYFGMNYSIVIMNGEIWKIPESSTGARRKR